MQPITIDPTLDLCTRWVDQDSVEYKVTKYKVSRTSTPDQHWDLNPGPSDLESSTCPLGHMLPRASSFFI